MCFWKKCCFLCWLNDVRVGSVKKGKNLMHLCRKWAVIVSALQQFLLIRCPGFQSHAGKRCYGCVLVGQYINCFIDVLKLGVEYTEPVQGHSVLLLTVSCRVAAGCRHELWDSLTTNKVSWSSFQSAQKAVLDKPCFAQLESLLSEIQISGTKSAGCLCHLVCPKVGECLFVYEC